MSTLKIQAIWFKWHFITNLLKDRLEKKRRQNWEQILHTVLCQLEHWDDWI